MNNFNSMYFDSTEVAAGIPWAFIKFLLTKGNTNLHKIDLHVYNEDCGAVIIEWVQQTWNSSWPEGRFKFDSEEEE